VYQSVLAEAISVALVQDISKEQRLIYFINQTLQEGETRYQMIEKVPLGLETKA